MSREKPNLGLKEHLFLNIERSRRVGAGEFFPATPYIFCLSGNEDYLHFWSEYMKDANAASRSEVLTDS